MDNATYESNAPSPSLLNPEGSGHAQEQNKIYYEVSNVGHEKRVGPNQTVSDEAKSPVNADQKSAITDKLQLDLISKDAANCDSSLVAKISPAVSNKVALKSENIYDNSSSEGNSKDEQGGGQHQKISNATKTQDNEKEHVNINKDSNKHDYGLPNTKNDYSTLFTKTDKTKTTAVFSQIIALEVKVDSKNPDFSKPKDEEENVADSLEENGYEDNYTNIEKKDNNEKMQHENDCGLADADNKELQSDESKKTMEEMQS